MDVRHKLGRMDILSPESLEAVELLLDPGNHSPGQMARIGATPGAHLLQHGMEKARQQGTEFDQGVFLRQPLDLPFIPFVQPPGQE